MNKLEAWKVYDKAIASAGKARDEAIAPAKRSLSLLQVHKFSLFLLLQLIYNVGYLCMRKMKDFPDCPRVVPPLVIRHDIPISPLYPFGYHAYLLLITFLVSFHDLA